MTAAARGDGFAVGSVLGRSTNEQADKVSPEASLVVCCRSNPPFLALRESKVALYRRSWSSSSNSCRVGLKTRLDRAAVESGCKVGCRFSCDRELILTD
jgi:hypothetical protein